MMARGMDAGLNAVVRLGLKQPPHAPQHEHMHARNLTSYAPKKPQPRLNQDSTDNPPYRHQPTVTATLTVTVTVRQGGLYEFFSMVMAGLVATTPHMMSATVMALARLTFEFASAMQVSARIACVSPVGSLCLCVCLCVCLSMSAGFVGLSKGAAMQVKSTSPGVFTFCFLAHALSFLAHAVIDDAVPFSTHSNSHTCTCAPKRTERGGSAAAAGAVAAPRQSARDHQGCTGLCKGEGKRIMEIALGYKQVAMETRSGEVGATLHQQQTSASTCRGLVVTGTGGIPKPTRTHIGSSPSPSSQSHQTHHKTNPTCA